LTFLLILALGILGSSGSTWNVVVETVSYCWFSVFISPVPGSFSALALLVGRHEEHPACKSWVMRCWHGCLSGTSCRWFAYGPADSIATPSSLTSLKSRMVQPFCCWLTQIVLVKTPLNGCLSICLPGSPSFWEVLLVRPGLPKWTFGICGLGFYRLDSLSVA